MIFSELIEFIKSTQEKGHQKLYFQFETQDYKRHTEELKDYSQNNWFFIAFFINL